jgi:hypothetical protein
MMKRRSFFQIIAGALIAPALPPVALGSSVPRLWADGVHDDGPGLTALLRQEVVEIPPHINTDLAGWITANCLVVPAATYSIFTPIVIKGMVDKALMFSGSCVVMKPGCDCGFLFEDGDGISISNLLILTDERKRDLGIKTTFNFDSADLT